MTRSGLAALLLLGSGCSAAADLDLGRDAEQARRLFTLLRLGLPPTTPIAIAFDGSRGTFVVRLSRSRDLAADRHVTRLRRLLADRRRIELNLVGPGKERESGLSFPLRPGRTEEAARGDLVVTVLARPSASAAVTLAHELFTHAFRIVVGLPSEHSSPGDRVGKDAARSEALARRNLAAARSFSPARMERARRDYAAFLEESVRGLDLTAQTRARRALEARFDIRDWVDFDVSGELETR